MHACYRYLAVQNTSSRSLDRWQTMQIVPNDTLCVTVYQLQPSTAYQFMIMSRNRHGDVMYSTPVATSTKGTYAMRCRILEHWLRKMTISYFSVTHGHK